MRRFSPEYLEALQEGRCPVCGSTPEERDWVQRLRKRYVRRLEALEQRAWQAYDEHWQACGDGCTEADPGCPEGRRLYRRVQAFWRLLDEVSPEWR